jgi:ABC-type antimicrobial peptide transport system permease subunit
MELTTAAAVAPRRFNLMVLAIFASVALVLSATGIYAMLSYAVSRRGREMAIRAALGACRWDLAGLVVRQGLMPAIAGILLGLVAAFAITRTLSGMLFELSTLDPLTFAAVPAVLLAVAVAACIGPGLRAANTYADGKNSG